MKGGPARSDREPAWPGKVPEAGRDEFFKSGIEPRGNCLNCPQLSGLQTYKLVNCKAEDLSRWFTSYWVIYMKYIEPPHLILT